MAPTLAAGTRFNQGVPNAIPKPQRKAEIFYKMAHIPVDYMALLLYVAVIGCPEPKT